MMEEDRSIFREKAFSPQDAKEGGLWRDILHLLPDFRAAGGTFYLRRWENGDSRCHFRGASSLQPLLLDLPWWFRGIPETRKDRVRSPGAEMLRCSPTISAG